MLLQSANLEAGKVILNSAMLDSSEHRAVNKRQHYRAQLVDWYTIVLQQKYRSELVGYRNVR